MSLPCLTPLVPMRCSATFLIVAAAARMTMTSRQFELSRAIEVDVQGGNRLCVIIVLGMGQLAG